MLFLLAEKEIVRLLNMDKALHLVEQAFQEQGKGLAVGHPSFALSLGKGSFRIHASALLGSKRLLASIFPAGRSWSPLVKSQSISALYDTSTGELLSVAPFFFVRLRIGAVMGVAAKYLSNPESKTATLIGTGRNALIILEAVILARPLLKEIAIYSRNRKRRLEFCRKASELFQVKFLPVESVKEAVKDRDIVITATDSKKSVVRARWLRPQCYVASTGLSSELGRDVFEMAKTVVVGSKDETRCAPTQHYNALIQLIKARRLAWKNVHELGDLVSSSGRQHPLRGITVFQSSQTDFPEVALAAWVHQEAERQGLGQRIRLPVAT